MILLGADEAGKGALYGPAVVAAVIVDQNKLKQILAKYRITDSKLLKKQYMKKVFLQLSSSVKHEFYLLTPKQIDSTNLNQLLTNAYKKLLKNKTFDEGYIDAPYENIEKFRNGLSSDSKLFIECKADSRYKIVGLASIFAKAKRQQMVENIKKQTLIDIGSGYPSDPKTRSAYLLNKNILAPYLRTKWNIKK